LRLFAQIVGGAGVVLIFFVGTLFALGHFKQTPDMVRSSAAKTMIDALEKYRTSKGGFPVPQGPDAEIGELSAPLVGGGFISAIPDPPGQKMRYASTGQAFGLLIYFDRGRCRVEVGVKNTQWWGIATPACVL
jgi:hypothetical protein